MLTPEEIQAAMNATNFSANDWGSSPYDLWPAAKVAELRGCKFSMCATETRVQPDNYEDAYKALNDVRTWLGFVDPRNISQYFNALETERELIFDRRTY